MLQPTILCYLPFSIATLNEEVVTRCFLLSAFVMISLMRFPNSQYANIGLPSKASHLTCYLADRLRSSRHLRRGSDHHYLILASKTISSILIVVHPQS
jgi:hypothetical protein